MDVLRKTFSIICYIIGFSGLIYYADFFMGYFVPKDINSGNPESILNALVIDAMLIIIFGLQHTTMARTGFKKWFEKYAHPSINRSFYVLWSTLALGILVWFWQPIPLVIFDLRGTATGSLLLVLYYLGWFIGVSSSFEINHFELFGLKQAFSQENKGPGKLKAPFFYRVVRHPIYLGWLLIHWMTPLMTVGHLFLGVGITIYIYIALVYEERDLIRSFGKTYLDYKRVTPKLNPLVYPIKKNAKLMKTYFIIVIIVGVLLVGSFIDHIAWMKKEMSLMKSNDPAIWEEVVNELHRSNHELYEQGSVLFIGSSSFRFWDNMQEDLNPIQVINNGFGGAKIPDVLYFQKQLIDTYQPKKIVFFLGSNDITGHEKLLSAEEILVLYEKLARSVHKKFPNCKLYILPITPTPYREDAWQVIRQVNSTIKEITQDMELVRYIDCADQFLDKDGRPKLKYFTWDGIHLNTTGYKIWAEALKDALQEKQQAFY